MKKLLYLGTQTKWGIVTEIWESNGRHYYHLVKDDEHGYNTAIIEASIVEASVRGEEVKDPCENT